ncbi:protein shisa-5-like isoform X2 [Thrips palmi]|uniref:Protein shisa-5-like isoform X2 n=1 Tax=Thrips palmi TaxID=161013 RepID=A0A6P8YRK8_THRPL|nr:protein shisa-5-like isoform X2 [Thrips palmi]
MFAVLALVLAGLASTQAYTCMLCGPIPGKDYCCYDYNDNHYCCSQEEYFKGGFLDQQTMIILIAVGVVVLVATVLFICCCCCSCCPCYRRRRQGVTLPPAYNLSSPTYYPAQYPAQHPSNPYIAPNASAPVYPTLPVAKP